MLTEEDAKKLIAAALPEIQKTLIADVKQEIVRQLNYSMATVIRYAVDEFMKEHIVPEIKAQLLDSKAGILKATCDAASEISGLIQKAVVEQVAEKLSDKYSRQGILKVLFNG